MGEQILCLGTGVPGNAGCCGEFLLGGPGAECGQGRTIKLLAGHAAIRLSGHDRRPTHHCSAGNGRRPALGASAAQPARHHSPSVAMTCPGIGSGTVAIPVGLAGSGRSVRILIIDRHVSTRSQAAMIAVPLLPISRPEVGRSSRVRPPDSRVAAVLAPMPLAPGMLSEMSPHRAQRSGKVREFGNSEGVVKSNPRLVW